MQSPTDKWLAELDAPWVRNPLESATDKWLKEFGLHQKPRELERYHLGCSTCRHCRFEELEDDESFDVDTGFMCTRGIIEGPFTDPTFYGLDCYQWE